MAVAAALKFTQNAVVGTAGRAYIGTTALPVTVANGNNSGVVKWTYTLLDVPQESGLTPGVLSTGTSPTTTFTPDVAYSYRVQVTVEDNVGNTATDIRCFGVPDVNGWIIPPYGATASEVNYAGQTRGWAGGTQAKALDYILRDLASKIGVSGPGVVTNIDLTGLATYTLSPAEMASAYLVFYGTASRGGGIPVIHFPSDPTGKFWGVLDATNAGVNEGLTFKCPSDSTGTTIGSGYVQMVSYAGAPFNAIFNVGFYPQTVNAVQLQGFDVGNSTPSLGDVLTWDGTKWAPDAPVTPAATIPLYFGATDLSASSGGTTPCFLQFGGVIGPAAATADVQQPSAATVLKNAIYYCSSASTDTDITYTLVVDGVDKGYFLVLQSTTQMGTTLSLPTTVGAGQMVTLRADPASNLGVVPQNVAITLTP